MREESWILILVTVVTAVGWIFFVSRVWVARRDSYLAGRVPILICAISFGCLAFVLAVIMHWIMLFERRGLPCYVLFWPAYVSECGTRSIYLVRGGDQTIISSVGGTVLYAHSDSQVHISCEFTPIMYTAVYSSILDVYPHTQQEASYELRPAS